MFTGLIQGIGTVRACQRVDADLRLSIDPGSLAQQQVIVGDSVAINGVCLTVVAQGESTWHFDVSAETLSRSTLDGFSSGDRVNLELAMLPTTRLGGHFVAGHVDGVGQLVHREPVGRSVQMRFKAPSELGRYIAEKGSICIDGVSLTINAVKDDEFIVNLIPHTLSVTTFGEYQPGRRVHLEVDLIARYLERLTQGNADQGEPESITTEFLAEHGFLAPE